ncbi:MAG: hypothetical protein AMR96_04995 [Candidatus Adiutrix intracellularis]|jgi:uncharacterized protein (DUF4213/DUF364 family)|nr:MAG: hypothetical protein AMR96_04995 [Candidatus Adiutrix intracellularis]MDR2827273.1 DUF364 domain-containing protein [Candidatus Adiutrix intracellularis]
MLVKLSNPADKWAFYDELIASISVSAKVENCVIGSYWVLIKSNQGGLGMAHFLFQNISSTSRRLEASELAGRPLSEVATLIKSWDYHAAAIGLAAVNAAVNTSVLISDSVLNRAVEEAEGSAFDFFLKRAAGRKVAVIGHFPNLEKLGQVANLSILESNPHPGDLPEPAAEYILPDQDIIFMTGTTIINKTMPRLLELSRQAEIYLVGPSTPMLPRLFDYGFYSLSGMVVRDYEAMAAAIVDDSTEEIFRHGGIKVNLVYQQG